MVRCLATAVILCGVTAAAASAQQSIGVSAVILERIDAGAVDVEVRSAGSRLSVRQSDAGAAAKRLLRSTFVHAGPGAGAAMIPERLRDSGLTRLERRVDGRAAGAERMVTVDRADRLTITRVIASDS
jgi:hypothetical protein